MTRLNSCHNCPRTQEDARILDAAHLPCQATQTLVSIRDTLTKTTRLTVTCCRYCGYRRLPLVNQKRKRKGLVSHMATYISRHNQRCDDECACDDLQRKAAKDKETGISDHQCMTLNRSSIEHRSLHQQKHRDDLTHDLAVEHCVDWAIFNLPIVLYFRSICSDSRRH